MVVSQKEAATREGIPPYKVYTTYQLYYYHYYNYYYLHYTITLYKHCGFRGLKVKLDKVILPVITNDAHTVRAMRRGAPPKRELGK